MNPIDIIRLVNLLFSSSPDYSKVKSMENEEEKHKIMVEYAEKQIAYCQPTKDQCFQKIQEMQKLGDKAACSRLQEFNRLCLEDRNLYTPEEIVEFKTYIFEKRLCSYNSYDRPMSCFYIKEAKKRQEYNMMQEYLKNNKQ